MLCTKTLHSFAKLYKPFTKRYTTSQNFTNLSNKIKDFTRFYQTLHNSLKFHNKRLNFTTFSTLYTSFTFLNFTKTLHNWTQLHNTSPNATTLYKILRNFTQLCKALQHCTKPFFLQFYIKNFRKQKELYTTCLNAIQNSQNFTKKTVQRFTQV